MNIMIIPEEVVTKLKEIEFPKGNRLDPVKGWVDGVEVYWLPADLKDNATFSSGATHFRKCEVRVADAVESKMFDPDTEEEMVQTWIEPVVAEAPMMGKQVMGMEGMELPTEIIPEGKFGYVNSLGTERDMFSLVHKTILTLNSEVVEVSTLDKLLNGVTAVKDGLVYVWDSVIGWFKS